MSKTEFSKIGLPEKKSGIPYRPFFKFGLQENAFFSYHLAEIAHLVCKNQHPSHTKSGKMPMWSDFFAISSRPKMGKPQSDMPEFLVGRPKTRKRQFGLPRKL